MGWWQWRKGSLGRPAAQRPVGRQMGRRIICGSKEPRANRVRDGLHPAGQETCLDPRGPHHAGDCTGASRTWKRRRLL